MGHRVPSHKGKCKNLHGHRYKVEVFVDGNVITKAGDSAEGMVIDFHDLKDIMMKTIDKELDHGFMMYSKDAFHTIFHKLFHRYDQKIIFVDFVPTAENIAKYIYEKLEPKLRAKKIRLDTVKLWETPSSTAIYNKGTFINKFPIFFGEVGHKLKNNAKKN